MKTSFNFCHQRLYFELPVSAWQRLNKFLSEVKAPTQQETKHMKGHGQHENVANRHETTNKPCVISSLDMLLLSDVVIICMTITHYSMSQISVTS